MYCISCGKGLPSEKAQFCPVCGSKQVPPAPSATPEATPYEFATTKVAAGSGNGVGTSGLVVGLIALFFGLYDYSLVAGTYDYLLPEEIGILFILSVLGIVFSSIGVSRKSTIATWGLVISLVSLFLTFYLASLG